MLVSVPTTTRSLSEFEFFVDPEEIEGIRKLASRFSGARVLHLNATSFGGGVSEILYTLVPLMRSVGIETDWKVLQGSDEFFSVTKIMHNSLQGMEIPMTRQMKSIYEYYQKLNADLLKGGYDFVIVHDPQPAGMPSFMKDYRDIGKHWIWRCHLDLTRLYQGLWDYLIPMLNLYDATIFTMSNYVGAHADVLPPCFIVPPSIDPLSPKNMPLEKQVIDRTLKEYRIKTNHPLITQVSRYDPWKDPLGVIDAYRLAKKKIPDLQLVLAASMASDDPESWHYYEKTARHAGEDDDIFLLSNIQGVGNLEINAFQRGSDIILQKSLQEGFGLTVTEALWKEKPVIGGNVGGITLQIDNDRNGFLVNSVEECADKIIYLYEHAKEGEKMGIAGKEKVRDNFLSTNSLKSYLNVFNEVLMEMESQKPISSVLTNEQKKIS